MSARIRDAATVVLIKDSASPGLDVWMLKRISELKFAPQAHVFPGGAVDKADDEHIPLTGGNLDELSQVMGVDPAKANRLISAAVRETFEESGVVLALNPETFEFTEEHRLQLLQGDVSMSELLALAHATIDAQTLIPWAWWLTPDYIDYRFDTWFFISPIAGKAEPIHVADGEAVEAGWWNVHEALAANARGEIMLLWPTLRVLLDLAQADSVEHALALRPKKLERQSG